MSDHGHRSGSRAEGPTGGSTSAEVDELVGSLLTASRALVAVSARSLGSVEDAVTPTQFRTLVVLDRFGPSRLNTLAARLEVGASTTLRGVDRLIAAGFVERHENEQDRREVVIGLTPPGDQLVATVTRVRRASIERIVRAMPAERRLHLVETLAAFALAADEPVVPADAATRLGW